MSVCLCAWNALDQGGWTATSKSSCTVKKADVIEKNCELATEDGEARKAYGKGKVCMGWRVWFVEGGEDGGRNGSLRVYFGIVRTTDTPNTFP